MFIKLLCIKIIDIFTIIFFEKTIELYFYLDILKVTLKRNGKISNMLFLKIKINKLMTFPRFLQECDNVRKNVHV